MASDSFVVASITFSSHLERLSIVRCNLLLRLHPQLAPVLIKVIMRRCCTTPITSTPLQESPNVQNGSKCLAHGFFGEDT